MQIERKDLDHQVEFRVIVPEERVESAFLKATNKLGKEALIPGFRKGKAPLQVIKAFLGKERIKDEALSTLLGETIDKVYEKEGITPLFSPQLTVEQFEEGMPFVFRLVVDPWPEFDLPPVEQVKIELPPPVVTEDDVDKTIYRLRESYATLILKEGPAETGDLVTIKWRIGNEPYTTEMLELGKKNFLPEFDQELLGVQAGETKMVEVNLKGEKIQVEVRVLEVKRKELPPENDQFALNFQAQSLEELREKVRRDLKIYMENDYQKQLKEEFLKKYIDLIPLEFSERAQEKALSNYVESFKEYLKSTGRNLSDFVNQLGLSEEEWRETIARKEALQTLKEQLVLSEVADERGIRIEESELRKALKEMEDREPESVYASLRRKKALDELFHDWQVSALLSQKEAEEAK